MQAGRIAVLAACALFSMTEGAACAEIVKHVLIDADRNVRVSEWSARSADLDPASPVPASRRIPKPAADR